MCGRYTLTDPDPARIRARFGLDESAKLEEEPRYNIAPTDPVLAIRRDRRGGARARTAALGPRPRALGRAPLGAAADQRARRDPPAPAGLRRVVPRAPLPDPGRRLLRVARRRAGEDADLGQPSRRRSVRLRRRLGRTAGSATGSGDLHSCAIVTCEPNELIRPIHDRMPVILSPTHEARWLEPDLAEGDLLSLLVPAPEELLVAREVDRRGQRRPRGRAPPARAARGAAAAVLAVAVPRAEARRLVLFERQNRVLLLGERAHRRNPEGARNPRPLRPGGRHRPGAPPRRATPG